MTASIAQMDFRSVRTRKGRDPKSRAQFSQITNPNGALASPDSHTSKGQRYARRIYGGSLPQTRHLSSGN
jgi:hypothetical protein